MTKSAIIVGYLERGSMLIPLSTNIHPGQLHVEGFLIFPKKLPTQQNYIPYAKKQKGEWRWFTVQKWVRELGIKPKREKTVWVDRYWLDPIPAPAKADEKPSPGT